MHRFLVLFALVASVTSEVVEPAVPMAPQEPVVAAATEEAITPLAVNLQAVATCVDNYGISGTCIDKATCKLGRVTAGKCPGAANIQCCTSPAPATCTDNYGQAGTCIDKAACTLGQVTAGRCPGAANIQCCTRPPPSNPSTGGALITLQQLLATMPGLGNARATTMLGFMNSAMREANIDTCPRLTAWLAQLGHESASLLYMEEIASGAAYEGRTDLGNTQPGDGKRFKGRGPIQLTGRSNYAAAGKFLGLDLIGNPYQVATPEVGFRTSAWFWNQRNLNNYADQNTIASFRIITSRINGGQNGAADRESRWYKAKQVLGC